MNTKIKQEWITALRSGKYKQTRGSLKDSEGYCCLGVLCELSPFEDWADGGYLSHDVRNWAELDNDNPQAGDNVLSQINDFGISFNEIADLIEKHL